MIEDFEESRTWWEWIGSWFLEGCSRDGDLDCEALMEPEDELSFEDKGRWMRGEITKYGQPMEEYFREWEGGDGGDDIELDTW